MGFKCLYLESYRSKKAEIFSFNRFVLLISSEVVLETGIRLEAVSRQVFKCLGSVSRLFVNVSVSGLPCLGWSRDADLGLGSVSRPHSRSRDPEVSVSALSRHFVNPLRNSFSSPNNTRPTLFCFLPT